MRKPKPEKPPRDVYIARFTDPKDSWDRWTVAYANRKPRKGCKLRGAVFDAKTTTFDYVKNFVALRADLNLVSDVEAKRVIELTFAESPQGDQLLHWLQLNWPQHRFARYGWSIIHVLTPATDLEVATMGRQAEIYLGRG